jgi:signal transduction histidine kinase
MDILRVLIVDDEPGMRHSITRALRNFTVHLPEIEGETEFALRTAESGEEALKVLAEESFDLMLLDHKLGGITGIDVLEEINKQEHEMLVIMITAFATIETAVRATKSGAFDFIAKPFTPDELKETVQKAAAHLMTQRRARQLAEEKRRVRFDFIRVLGHELKSPLAAITSYLDLLKGRVAGENVSDYDKVIDRSLIRAAGMRKLIADLLDMTRIEAGEKKRELTEVDVVEAAQAAIDGALVQAEERGIAIELHTSGPLTMIADMGEIEIVLNNLVSNAVKYNRDQGRVDVRLTGDDDRISIAVQDTGIGLGPEEARKLFNDFVRIKNDQTRDIEGSGLGLSIVKKIASLYGGTVGVKSEKDVGSMFTVVLKRHVRPQEAGDDAARDKPVAAGA